MTWAILLVGCSGLVPDVGSDKFGLVRSPRLFAGATGRHPLPLSGLMQLGPTGIVAAVDCVELEDPPDPPQALGTSPTTTPTLSSAAPGQRFDPGRGVRPCWWRGMSALRSICGVPSSVGLGALRRAQVAGLRSQVAGATLSRT